MIKVGIVALALAAAAPAFAGERTLAEATPALDWELYHARQDACREKDRLRVQCALVDPDYAPDLLRRGGPAAGAAGMLGFWPFGRAAVKRYIGPPMTLGDAAASAMGHEVHAPAAAFGAFQPRRA